MKQNNISLEEGIYAEGGTLSISTSSTQRNVRLAEVQYSLLPSALRPNDQAQGITSCTLPFPIIPYTNRQ